MDAFGFGLEFNILKFRNYKHGLDFISLKVILTLTYLEDYLIQILLPAIDGIVNDNVLIFGLRFNILLCNLAPLSSFVFNSKIFKIN